MTTPAITPAPSRRPGDITGREAARVADFEARHGAGTLTPGAVEAVFQSIDRSA